MDIVRGKATDKTAQYGHERISTFGLCADNTELQLRAVLRQLIATDALRADSESFNTLYLTEASRAVLKGEVPVLLRQSLKQARAKSSTSAKLSGVRLAKDDASQSTMDEASQARFAVLKAWRGEVAAHHNLPAFVIFHDSTLRLIALLNPTSVDQLSAVSGIGAKKLEAYGEEVLAVIKRSLP